MPIYRLTDEPLFPDPEKASDEGIVAVGGDLSPQRLVNAYANGIFPWFSQGDPLIWWSPDPRMVLFPKKIKLSKSLQKTLKTGKFDLKVDTAFEEVISNCQSVKRKDEAGTWITEEMKTAYIELHNLGLAHSFECWQNKRLVGGLYGVSLGNAFFGESMFHKVTDASKVAFYYLSKVCLGWNIKFIDCQLPTDHLQSLGAESISRKKFLNLLSEALQFETKQGVWKIEVEK